MDTSTQNILPTPEQELRIWYAVAEKLQHAPQVAVFKSLVILVPLMSRGQGVIYI